MDSKNDWIAGVFRGSEKVKIPKRRIESRTTSQRIDFMQSTLNERKASASGKSEQVANSDNTNKFSLKALSVLENQNVFFCRCGGYAREDFYGKSFGSER